MQCMNMLSITGKGYSKIYSENPFTEDPLPKSFYHPTQQRQLSEAEKQLALTSPTRQDGRKQLDDEEGAEKKFLAGSHDIKSLPTVQKYMPKSPNSDNFDESWPDSERPSTASLRGSADQESLPYAAVRKHAKPAFTSSPIELHTAGRTDHGISELYSNFGKTSVLHGEKERGKMASGRGAGREPQGGDKGSVLQRYIERFRHGKPMSREERMQLDAQKSEFWWLDSNPPTPNDTSTPKDEAGRSLPMTNQGRGTLTVENLRKKDDLDFATAQLQERAERVISSAQSMTSSGPIVSTVGLGSTGSDVTGSSFSEPVVRPAYVPQSGPYSMPERGRAAHGAKGGKEDDILFQWRLRRKLEVARETRYVPTESGSPRTTDEKEVHSRLAAFRDRLMQRGTVGETQLQEARTEKMLKQVQQVMDSGVQTSPMHAPPSSLPAIFTQQIAPSFGSSKTDSGTQFEGKDDFGDSHRKSGSKDSKQGFSDKSERPKHSKKLQEYSDGEREYCERESSDEFTYKKGGEEYPYKKGGEEKPYKKIDQDVPYHQFLEAEKPHVSDSVESERSRSTANEYDSEDQQRRRSASQRSSHSPRSARSPREAQSARSSHRESDSARQSQRETGSARSSQRESDSTRQSQRESGSARSSQRESESARSSQGQSESARSSQGQSGSARQSQRESDSARQSQRESDSARSSQREPHSERSSRPSESGHEDSAHISDNRRMQRGEDRERSRDTPPADQHPHHDSNRTPPRDTPPSDHHVHNDHNRTHPRDTPPSDHPPHHDSNRRHQRDYQPDRIQEQNRHHPSSAHPNRGVQGRPVICLGDGGDGPRMPASSRDAKNARKKHGRDEVDDSDNSVRSEARSEASSSGSQNNRSRRKSGDRNGRERSDGTNRGQNNNSGREDGGRNGTRDGRSRDDRRSDSPVNLNQNNRNDFDHGDSAAVRVDHFIMDEARERSNSLEQNHRRRSRDSTDAKRMVPHQEQTVGRSRPESGRSRSEAERLQRSGAMPPPQYSSSPARGSITSAIGQVVHDRLFDISGSVMSSVESLSSFQHSAHSPAPPSRVQSSVAESDQCESDGEFGDDPLLVVLRHQRQQHEMQLRLLDAVLSEREKSS